MRLPIYRFKTWLTLTAAAACATACTVKTNHKSSQIPPGWVQSSGNGDSYSGKTYKFKNPNGACPTDIESAIVFNADGEFFLTRENCETLNPFIQLEPGQVNHDFQNSQLTYDGEVYVNEYNPSCSYPEYPSPIPDSGGDCSATPMQQAVFSTNIVSSGNRYEFAIYNASSATHDFYNRHITYQRVSVDAGLAANSVDIVVSSYEPVRWEFIGNVAAIRSVHIRGYHCATYTGVDPALVSLSTYEQGSSPNVLSLPLALNLAAQSSMYEGTCAPSRTFVVQ